MTKNRSGHRSELTILIVWLLSDRDRAGFLLRVLRTILLTVLLIVLMTTQPGSADLVTGLVQHGAGSLP